MYVFCVYVCTFCVFTGLTLEALSTTFSTDGILCGRLVYLALQIGRGLRRTMFTAVLIHKFRRTMFRCWYSLSWQHAVDQASAADSLVHCCCPVSGDATSCSVRAMLLKAVLCAGDGTVTVGEIRVVSCGFLVS